jgi:hypothetical protein
MSEIKSPATIRISRVTSNMGDDYIEIEIRDKPSRQTAFRGRMSLQDFAMLVTGRGDVPIEAEWSGLDRVGKIMEMREIEFPIPANAGHGERRKRIAIAEAARHTPDGWFADTYFASLSSFFCKNGEDWARTTIRRWVEPEPPAVMEDNHDA